MVKERIISLNCIICLAEFFIDNPCGEKNCFILDVVAREEGNPTGRLGAPVDISKVPINQVEVDGCGMEEFDGTYTKETEIMYKSAPVYSKKGLWKGKEVTFVIFMSSVITYNWYIGTWIGDIDSGGGPNNSYYSSTYDSRHDIPPSCVTPPENGWVVMRIYGTNPAPTCRLIRGGN